MTRDEFREAVLFRDKNNCVVCGKPATAAHHILDRSLWESGGYDPNNGVSLCDPHHCQAELTEISCEGLRTAAKIKKVVLPDHFFMDEKYDHWGNIVLPSGLRIKGEKFDHCRDILSRETLAQFVDYVKYPRTYHVPWSPNLQNDDRKHSSLSFFIGKDVVVTTKMDGEGTSMYPYYMHARSIESKHHESRSWVKALHGKIKHDIPAGWRVCGENLYAMHSIHYQHLCDYFNVFNIWNENNIALNWTETEKWATLLGLKCVPVISKFTWENEAQARTILDEAYTDYCNLSEDPVEGYVIRVADEIPYQNYRLSTAKFVRKGHVQTSQHWMAMEIIPNKVVTL